MYLLIASNDRNKNTTTAATAAETETVESMDMDLEAALDRSTTTRAENDGMEDATIDNKVKKRRKRRKYWTL